MRPVEAFQDQRGYPRAGAVDIGAYEWQPDLIFENGFDGG